MTTARGDSGAGPRLFVPPPRSVWWVSAAWVGLLLAFSVLSPLFQAPDEPQHIDRVLDASSRAGFEDPLDGAMRTDVSRMSAEWQVGFFPPKFSEDRAPEHPRQSLLDYGSAEPQEGNNYQTQHPPGYYMLMATARTAITSMLPTELWTADREVMLLRLLNVLLLVPVPYLCWVTARQMGWPGDLALLAAMFPLAIPQLGFVGGSVNNDNLVILSGALVFLACARILHHRMDVPAALLLAASTAVALMAKGNAVALLPLVAVVAVVAWRRGGSQRRLAVVSVAVAATGGLFYVRNLFIHGEPFPSSFVHVATRTEPVDLAAFGRAIVSRTAETFWGKFGWLAVPMPEAWTWVLMALVVLAVVIALVRGNQPHLRVMLIPAAAAALLYIANAFQGYEESGVFPSQQGRYLFVCVVPLALAVAAVASGRPVLGRRSLSVLILVNHALAVFTLFDFYWPGGLFGGLRSIAAWSPLGTVAAVLVVGCWLLLVGSMVALERDPGSVPEPAGGPGEAAPAPSAE